MRLVHAAVLLAVSASPALAQRGPYIVIPGRPDVPIFENGVDVSWSVVEGEYGLDRPNIVNPNAAGGRALSRSRGAGARLFPAGWDDARLRPSRDRAAAEPPIAAASPKLQPLVADGVSAHARRPSVEQSEHHRAGDHALCLPWCGPARSTRPDWASQMIASGKSVQQVSFQ